MRRSSRSFITPEFILNYLEKTDKTFWLIYDRFSGLLASALRDTHKINNPSIGPDEWHVYGRYGDHGRIPVWFKEYAAKLARTSPPIGNPIVGKLVAIQILKTYYIKEKDSE